MSIVKPRQVKFKVTKWELEENEDDIVIKATGLTKGNKSVHVRIEGFHPFAFLQLPSRVDWTPSRQKSVIRYFQKKMNIPQIDFVYEQKFLSMYKEPAEFLKISMPTNKLLNHLSYKVFDKRGINIPGLGFFSFREFMLHEHNIDPIIKFTTVKNITVGGWIHVTERLLPPNNTIPPEERRTTTCDKDMSVYHTKVRAIDPIGRTNPKMCSFDIETYSKNKNARNPDPGPKQNCVFQIAAKFGKLYDDPDSYSSYLLSLRKCPSIEGTEVRNFATEKELILGFVALIHEMNPDVFTGYNILKFDWEYLLKRAAQPFNGCYNALLKCGRVYGSKSKVETVKWSSSAYGEQKFDYLNPDGRVNVDVYPEVERNYKMDVYSLGAVSEKFLGESKEDMPYKQMFTLFQMATLFEKMEAKNIKVKNMKQELKQCMEVEDLLPPEEGDRRNHVYEIWHTIRKAKSVKDIDACIREGMHRIGVYCVQDTLLPVKLMQKLHIWEGLEQMSNVTCVPNWYLQTRGQQIKVLAQFYRRTLKSNIVIKYTRFDNGDDDQKYQGATVITAEAGFYRDVVTLDFASLYPSIIIARNICYTTLVRDESVPDEECHVIEWQEHRGCQHDTSGKKVKAEDILCGSHRYRFRKKEFGGEGLFPAMLRELLSERKKVKKEMKQIAKQIKEAKGDTKSLQVDYVILDARQKGLKISANSGYGFMGAKKGYGPMKEGAASVTAEGRRMIHSTSKLITDKYPQAKVIYGDTDSVMVQFNGCSIEEKFRLGREAAAYVTETFLKPNELEFECVYDPFLQFTKKRYAANVIDEQRNVLEVIDKGVLSARRDNFHFIRNDLYKPALMMIRSYAPEDEVMYYLITKMNSMFQRQVAMRKFVLYVSVKDVDSYDEDAKLVNAMLARKMALRGDNVSNTRLEYVFLRTSDASLKKSAKAEDWSYFLENYRKKKLKIDYLCYLEKSINPFTELFDIMYPKKEVLYEKHDEAVQRQINLLDVPSQGDFSIERLSHIRRVRDKITYIRMHLKREDHPALFNSCDRYIAINSQFQFLLFGK